jgi:hypothetical protein
LVWARSKEQQFLLSDLNKLNSEFLLWESLLFPT